MKFSQRPGLAAFANHRPLSPFEERCFRLEQGLPVSRPVPTTAQPGSPVRVLVPVDGGRCHHVAGANPTLVESASGKSRQEFDR